MKYVGIDPLVGLECSECEHITRVRYSVLLDRVDAGACIECEDCRRQMQHDWTTVSVVRNIISRRMQEANQARTARQSVPA